MFVWRKFIDDSGQEVPKINPLTGERIKAKEKADKAAKEKADKEAKAKEKADQAAKAKDAKSKDAMAKDTKAMDKAKDESAKK